MSAMDAPDGSLTESLSRVWAGLRYEDLPPAVINAAKRSLLDTVAAGIGAAHSEVVGSVLSAVCAMHGPSAANSSGSPSWGRHERLHAASAALVNGTACHVLELDDYGGCGHSGAVVIPAVLALTDIRNRAGAPASGRDLLVAIVAGYDIAARVMTGVGGYRAHTKQGWHSTGTCGSFGAAAAASKLLRLDEERFVAALGIAGSFTGGIWAFLADGSMTKRLHCGKAAETGVAAALLARHGVTGPRKVLDASWGGFYETYGGAVADAGATLDGLGTRFEILKSGMKPYPCCRDMHHAIDGVLAIMNAENAKHQDISALRVHGNAQTEKQFSNASPKTALDAQFSFPYALAVAAVSGQVSQTTFFPLRTTEPEIAQVMRQVSIVADSDLGTDRYPSIEIVFKDGRTRSMDVVHAKGAPQNPLTDRELEEKAIDLIAPILGSERCAAIIAAAGRIEHLADAETFTALLRNASREGALQ